MYDKSMTIETTARQQKYVEDKERAGNGLGLVFADAFLRGMRDIGYKSPAWALCEMVDNAVQAQAQKAEVIFGDVFSEKGGEQPGQIAVADDGVGMIPKMISYAVRWGGTDRENDRHGFGRYGYGLPSSAVSIASRYTVYSKVRDGEWYKVTVDIAELAKIASDINAIERALEPVLGEPPGWVVKGLSKIDFKTAESGTLIVLEDLDRLQKLHGWRTVKALKSKLLESLGMVYRHWVPEPRIFVDGEEVQAVDPLFLMEHGRFYTETEVAARKVDARTFTVVAYDGEEAPVTIRASYLPFPKFQWPDPAARPKRRRDLNSRFGIMKATNGLIICRDGRQIDVVQPPEDWTRFQNYDRNIKIEIDFDPRLDEFFGITTSKQQITIDDSMWDRLLNRGKVLELIEDLRRMRDEDRAKHEGAVNTAESSEQERPSEQAMRETGQFKVRPHKPTEQQEAEARRNLEAEVVKISEVSRQDREAVLAQQEEQAARRPFKMEWTAVEEGPFYRPVRVGVQKRLILNTNHPFYSRVYEPASPESRAALEVLLFVLGESELEAGTADAEQFYKAARNQWSERLRNALEALRSDQDVRDAAAAAAESMEVQATAETA